MLLLLACTAPAVRVVAVDELGEMSAPDGIVGRDGGVSARLGDVAWWVYGDTVVDSWAIVLRTATELTGPWSETLTITTPDGDDLRHAGAHAELQEDEGRVIYVSYLVDTFHLLRVELEPV